MDEEIEASLATSLAPNTEIHKVICQLPEHHQKFLSGLDVPPNVETPILFSVYAISKNKFELISEALPSHFEIIEGSGVLPAVLNSLKDQIRMTASSDASPSQSRNNALSALEALAFCRFERSIETITDDDLGLPDSLDLSLWQRSKETHSSATAGGYVSINHGTQTAQRDALFEPARASHKDAHHFISPWILKLLITNVNRSKASVDKWWPIVVPILLNRLDSTDIKMKKQTIELVHLLASHHTERLVHSGLIPVLEASIEPCMSYLSPLVDTAETMLIHRPTILCLAQLSRGSPARLNFIARQGCLKPFLHTKESSELTIYFFQTLQMVVATYLKTLVIVHLSAVVDIFTSVMCNPFLDGSPELALIAVETMAEVIKWAWPRVDQYKYKILLGLTKSNRLESPLCDMLGAFPAELEKLRTLMDL